MAINNGVIEMTTDNVVVRIYYDPNLPNQPVINGPRGFALDLTNIDGRPIKTSITRLDGTLTRVNVGKGDPVTTGQGRSLTAAQLNVLGYLFRADFGNMIGPEL